MKFELVEPAEPPDAPEPAAGVATGSSAEPTVPPASSPGAHEVLAARMRDRSEELGTRLTRIIEAVRPALHRMEAGIVRAERELAGSGHGPAPVPPDTFRADRFAGKTAREAVTAPAEGSGPAAVAPAPATNEENR
ncbi:hypothetical protein [Nocardiopsis alborubida]|uniref:Uncharacterized protein n=1 Tax=Nocardiopsis alborubida TaxID=146802 RepID=A0A7X6RSU6_9ACTN|nr:hypothetical protein [Nocardiopsis alborubida]NKZ01049.1 hypothetical protein [Nocardiopsis alborubida]